MGKRQLLPFLLFAIGISSKAQDNIGYTTTDIGGEIQWHSPGGYSAALHLAFNGEVHNTFQVRAGYMIANRKDRGEHAIEKGNGPGGGLGYRYYFPYRPHQFFLGIRSDIWRLKIDWEDAPSARGATKTWTIQPAAEAGYMFLINDMIFITPAVSAGYFSNLAVDGEKTGEGFVFSAGISIGMKR